jgi:MFS superfamily sulfate permease-like transporter
MHRSAHITSLCRSGTSYMRQSGIVLALLVALLVAFLVYQFDPWVGIAVAVAVLVIAVVAAVASRTAIRSEQRTFSSDVAWDEEEPVNLDNSNSDAM